MEPKQTKYPIFEDNQVLSNTCLNQVFSYLDEQERLTRANLIGIGIACGLEIQLDLTNSAIQLSKGCGVTSEGYLIVEPEDLELVSYRKYELPDDLDYQPFKNKSLDPKVPYPLWELFPPGEPDTTLLETPADFLSDKGMLLFLELKKEGLRNCSPNDCNDKGMKVTATLRRLLINLSDLKTIIIDANNLEIGLTFSDLETVLLARFNLPDLRIPRYDVPNTGPASSNQVLAAFHAVFQTGKLVLNTENALIKAYEAFKPLLQRMHPTNPFANFSTKFGFLDKAPQTKAQALFLQYYYDFFDDLLKAYDEFRWKGAELLCGCCPPEGLFPRHLMLGVLFPDDVDNQKVYRHHFLASAVTRGCEECTKELEQLFRRLVEMIVRFTDTPPLAKISDATEIDEEIRITPSRLASVPLSEKAIPYYYLQTGEPPLFKLWNFKKTRRSRGNQNLSYRSDEYTPPTPAFITDALNYDLDQHDFLRIEGHLGKDYQSVLKTLLAFKAQYRLPIEVIALRTGAFDENISIDLTKESCWFHDLEVVYDALREELLSALCEGVRYLYGISIAKSELPGGKPKHTLLKKYAPNYRHKKGTVGAWYEKYLGLIQSLPYIDVDQQKIDSNEVLKVYCILFAGTEAPDAKYYAYIVSIYYFTKLAAILPPSLNKLGYADFENKYQDLIGLIRFFRSDAVAKISDEFKKFIPQEDLIDHFDQVLFSCKLEPIKTVYKEYVRRIIKIKQKQFLSFFLKNNPGIQHKAGVPMCGTFIIVYHEDPKPIITKPGLVLDDFRVSISPPKTFGTTKENTAAILGAISRISAKRKFVLDKDIRFLIGRLTGQVPDISHDQTPTAGSEADKIIAETVKNLNDGTVIADFYLPYLCCSDCKSVQYVLPVPPLGLTIELGCTDPNGSAEAKLTPQGGIAPIIYQLDNQPFREITGKLLLTAGQHSLVIRDSAGAESALQSVTIPEPLSIGTESYAEDVSAQTYRVSFDISGGTVPYKIKATQGTVTGSSFISKPIKSGKKIQVTITDNVGCKVTKEFEHTVPPPCDLPCDGLALRCGYLFWLPESDPERKKLYREYKAAVKMFKFEFPQGRSVDLSLKDLNKIIQASPVKLNQDFNKVVQSWLEKINELIFEKTGSKDSLWLEYSNLQKDTIGTLKVEHFECLNFAFHIISSFRFENSELPEVLELIYTPQGTQIKEESGGEFSAKIPAFNCIQIDKCDPERPEVDLCEEVDLKLRIESKVEDQSVLLDFIFEGDDKPFAWLWEVQDGIPVLSNEKPARFKFSKLEPLTKFVQLTAYTEKGCKVSKIGRIEIG